MRLKQLMKEATTITPNNLNFYDEIFNWKKSSAQRIVHTHTGIKVLPRKIKLGSLARSVKNVPKLATIILDDVLPIKDGKLTSIEVIQ